ncbi:serine protease gd-like [Melitaea cinxia]|uniref:serine protease gd-like n=1 Tax=Melitaea cinxia TaxID=113334 RepID=UPI001E274BCA|nr:serine protease gd-like [Melitaea cinxia]
MEVSVVEAVPEKGRKRKRQPENWKAKKAKIKGYSPKCLPENITCNHNTKSFACKQLKMLDLVHFHRSFYSKPIKQHQDALILKCCSVKKTARKRPVKNTRKSRAFSIKYAIYAKSLKKAIPVCQKVFLNTLGITKYRVQFVMQNFFESGQVPTEKRGGDHEKQKYAALRQSVHRFLKSLNCVEAHYCRGSSQQRKYLPRNPKSLCKTGKNAGAIRPTIIPNGIEVNPLKLRDVRNLLQKHYGDSWQNLPHLGYFHAVLNNQDEDELRLLEERGIEEENYTVEDLCEVQVEQDNLRHVRSPCPDYFDYVTDGSGTYGVIVLQPFGPVSSLLVRGNFTIAARLAFTYAGSIEPVVSSTHLLQDFNRGVPLKYRVNFPVTSPLPKITSLTVNDNVVCYATGDLPGEAQYVTTISLQHMLFFKSGSDGLYNALPPQTQQPEIIYVQEPQRPPSNINPTFEVIETNQSPWNQDIPRRTTESPRTTSTPRLIYTRPTTQRTRPIPSRPINTYRPALNPIQTSSTINSMECGINSSPIVPLIIQGYSYDRGEWPWLVAIYKIQKFSSLSYICAGTLISATHVVSAAHCMKRKSSYTAAKNLVVKAGVYNLEDWSDDITVTRTLQAASIHEAYNATTLANDLLVMTLEKPVPFGTYIKPACLWSGNPDLNRIVGTSGVVAGWGANEIGPGGTGEPRMVHMPIVSTATCRASKPEFHKLTSTKTLCAGDHSGSGPCLGDSGGGLYILDNGRWRLRGVVSLSLWSDNGDSTCNLEDYVVFTDTAQYLPWIRKVMSN